MREDVISELTRKLLFDAMSAVTVIDVESNTTIEGGLVIYIKTNSIEDIDVSALEKSVDKHSTEGVSIEFLIPKTKFIKGVHEKNEDIVCFFINEMN